MFADWPTCPIAKYKIPGKYLQATLSAQHHMCHASSAITGNGNCVGIKWEKNGNLPIPISVPIFSSYATQTLIVCLEKRREVGLTHPDLPDSLSHVNSPDMSEPGK